MPPRRAQPPRQVRSVPPLLRTAAAITTGEKALAELKAKEAAKAALRTIGAKALASKKKLEKRERAAKRKRTGPPSPHVKKPKGEVPLEHIHYSQRSPDELAARDIVEEERAAREAIRAEIGSPSEDEVDPDDPEAWGPDEIGTLAPPPKRKRPRKAKRSVIDKEVEADLEDLAEEGALPIESDSEGDSQRAKATTASTVGSKLVLGPLSPAAAAAAAKPGAFPRPRRRSRAQESERIKSVAFSTTRNSAAQFLAGKSKVLSAREALDQASSRSRSSAGVSAGLSLDRAATKRSPPPSEKKAPAAAAAASSKAPPAPVARRSRRSVGTVAAAFASRSSTRRTPSPDAPPEF